LELKYNELTNKILEEQTYKNNIFNENQVLKNNIKNQDFK
jgi:hypothetical protein